MNWLNGFEILCYVITALLIADIFMKKSWKELQLFISAALAGFILELLAVRVTGIYHYSPAFYISLGFEPYQFPFFGGLMWGGLTVCALRIVKKLGFDPLTSGLVCGWLIVSMDLLLDVAAIRLDGGFWVWEGRAITLDITHHMFMSVIWVNFLGYLFETPAVVYLTERSMQKENTSALRNILATIGIGLGGVAVVGIASGVSLLLNRITDEWFACIAFIILWGFILFRLIRQIINMRNRLTFKKPADFALMIFWIAMYGYCIAGLLALGILQAVPWYGALAMLLTAGTILLCMVQKEE